MPLLAIDSGGRACSAAVWRAGAVIATETVEAEHGQAATLMPLIQRVMADSGLRYGDLARIAVTVGPGSFTGLRVGLAAALGLALAADRPAVGISSFQAAAAALPPGTRGERRLFVLLDSRRDQPFLAELDAALDFVAAPMVVEPDAARAMIDAAGPTLLTGDSPLLAAGGFGPDVLLAPAAPHATSVAALAAHPAGRFDAAAKPVYLRAPDVTLPKATASA
jgi:tRNA threonylcarbamoyladenosine biosynthesis protein TsaB